MHAQYDGTKPIEGKDAMWEYLFHPTYSVPVTLVRVDTGVQLAYVVRPLGDAEWDVLYMTASAKPTQVWVGRVMFCEVWAPASWTPAPGELVLPARDVFAWFFKVLQHGRFPPSFQVWPGAYTAQGPDRAFGGQD